MSDGTTKKIKDIVVGDMIETCDTTTLLNSSEKLFLVKKQKRCRSYKNFSWMQ
jgi:hypothetical protein